MTAPPDARGHRPPAHVRFRPLLVAAAGGVCVALASPPTDWYPALLVGYALLAATVAEAPTARRAFGRAVAWGTAAQIVGLRFVPEVIARFTPLPLAAGLLALVLLSMAQSLTWAIGMTFASVLLRRLRAPLELAFAAGTFVALSLPTIFAWSPAGLVTAWPSLVQLADLIGERGVSALMAVGAALLARGLLGALGVAPGAPWPERLRLVAPRAAIRPTIACAAIFAALAVHGTLRIAQVERARADLPTVAIGLVDHAVAPLDRWNAKNHAGILKSLKRLTQEVERDGAELTIWPEAAYPYVLDHEQPRLDRGARAILGGGVKGPVLFGVITRTRSADPGDDGHDVFDSFNSAAIVGRDGGVSAPSDKLQLLWFGETVPGGSTFPWLRRLFQRSGGLVPGAEPRALTLDREGSPALEIAVLNCYEDTLTGVGRRVTTALGPNLLVNVTNDAWFYDTAESELHARLAAMRAIEMRRDLVRAVNLGVMTWVDSAGVVRARWTESRQHAMVVTPALSDAPLTLYARLGDAPCLALLAAAALAFYARARRRERAAAPEPARSP